MRNPATEAELVLKPYLWVLSVGNLERSYNIIVVKTSCEAKFVSFHERTSVYNDYLEITDNRKSKLNRGSTFIFCNLKL